MLFDLFTFSLSFLCRPSSYDLDGEMSTGFRIIFVCGHSLCIHPLNNTLSGLCADSMTTTSLSKLMATFGHWIVCLLPCRGSLGAQCHPPRPHRASPRQQKLYPTIESTVFFDDDQLFAIMVDCRRADVVLANNAGSALHRWTIIIDVDVECGDSSLSLDITLDAAH